MRFAATLLGAMLLTVELFAVGLLTVGLPTVGLLTSGCARSGDPPPPPSSAAPPAVERSETAQPAPIRVVDDAGRTVSLAGPARRVVSLAPSHTELLWAIGAGAQVVGRTPHCDHPPAAAATPSVGSLFPPDYERIIGARPDLVVMLDGSVDVRRKLHAQGLTVVIIQPRALTDIGRAMRALGRLTGREDTADEAARAFEQRLRALSRPAADGPSVFYEVGADPLYGAGPSSFVSDLIHHAGGRNALRGDAEWPRLSVEQLIAAAPQVIIVGTAARQSTLRASAPPGWATIPAMRRGAVHAVPDADHFVRPGPRVLDGLAWLRERLATAPR